MHTRVPRALSIAGSDSGGGAGIQADLKTFVALGVYGSTVVTAVTAQNTRGLHGARVLSPDLVAQQLRAVLDDGLCDAAKVGMLGSVEVLRCVALTLRGYPPFPLVVDPVLHSSSGTSLLAEGGIAALREELLPRTTLLTPNLDELALLCGLQRGDVVAPRDRIAAAETLIESGASAVLVKGGHDWSDLGEAVGFPNPADPSQRRVLDLFHDGKRVHRFEHPWIDTRCTHGTGCVLSAAITGALALGLPLLQAVERGRQHLLAALRTAVPIGPGTSPVNHALAKWGR